MHTHDATSRTRSRRAFAFVMVILLMMVVSMGIGLSMMRFSAQSKTVSREVTKYTEHHLGRGLQEAIGAWLRQQNGRDLHEALEPETGYAMDIILADGTEVSVFLRDAQGAALSNLTNLSELEIEEGGLLLRNLAGSTTENQYLRETRPFGPFRISIASASDRVLDAAARVVAGSLADRFLAELDSIRYDTDTITRSDLTRVATGSGLDAQQRAAMFRVFATDVELWAVIIEVRSGRGMRSGELVARYGGITQIRLSSNNRSGNPMELGAFITWRKLEPANTVDLSELY